MDEEILTHIEEHIEDLPEEVKDFIFGEEMETIKQELLKQILNADITNDLINDVRLFISEAFPFEELLQKINALGIGENQKNVVKNIIQEKILDELISLVEIHQELESGETSSQQSLESKTINAPSPTDILETLKSRLTEAKTIAPTVRRLDIGKATTQSQPFEEKKLIIDPYRELPDK